METYEKNREIVKFWKPKATYFKKVRVISSVRCRRKLENTQDKKRKKKILWIRPLRKAFVSSKEGRQWKSAGEGKWLRGVRDPGRV